MSDALTDIRENGAIQWSDIVDETRSLEDYTGYASIKDEVQDQPLSHQIEKLRTLANATHAASGIRHQAAILSS